MKVKQLVLVLIFFHLFNLSCENKPIMEVDPRNSEIRNEVEVKEFQFMDNYKYIDSVEHLPKYFLDSLLGDIDITDEPEYFYEKDSVLYFVSHYNKVLFFFLSNSSTQLISYSQSGTGTHDVVEIFERCKDSIKHSKFTTLGSIIDTNKLKHFLDSIDFEFYE